MRERGSDEHRYANTPHFVLKTVLLFLFPSFSGINFFAFIAFLLSCTGGTGNGSDRELLICGIMILAFFVFTGILNVFDNRGGMKTLTAVIIWAAVYAASAVLPFVPAFLPGLAVAASEAAVFAIVVFILYITKNL